MRSKYLILFCGLAVAGMTLPAAAEDLQPPWWRGELSTTSQVWEFSDPTTPPGVAIPPDGPAPGGNDPLDSTQLIWEPGPTPWDHWLEQDQPYEYEPGEWVGLGVIPLSGWIDVIVDNHDPKPENEKWIWVQVTWRPQDEGEEPIFEGLEPAPVDPPVIVEEIWLGVGQDGDPLAWRETTYFWKLDWNPPDESFTISGTINIDELVIDTWCVPEPATLALVAIGAVALLRRKRA